MYRNHNAGFTLLELSVVLVIMGILTAGGLVAGAIMIEKKSIIDTKALVEQANEALTDYYKVNGRLPCVASMLDEPGTANFGVELDEWAADTCFNKISPPAGTWEVDNGSGNWIRIGMLPVRTLGLNDSAARDHFNSRLLYAVTEKLTNDGSFGAATGAINVLDSDGNIILSDAAFVVLSHGKDKKGAYQFQTGSQVTSCGTSTNLDVVNCTVNSGGPDDAAFRDAAYNDGEMEDFFFDDLVAWVPKFHLMGERTVSSSLWAVGTGNNIYSVGVDENTNTTNVGIGTDDPENKLQVEGITAASAFRLRTTYASLAELYAQTEGDELIVGTVGGISGLSNNETVFMNSDNNQTIPDDGISFINYGTSGADSVLRIAGDSRVGIGTANPETKLHVNGAAAGDRIRLTNGSGTLDIGPQNSNWAHFITDRPSFYFNMPTHVNGPVVTYSGGAQMNKWNGSSSYGHFSHSSNNGTGNYALLQHSGGTTYLNSAPGTHLYFRNDNTTRMILRGDTGRLGINTTAPRAGLHIRARQGGFSSGNKLGSYPPGTENNSFEMVLQDTSSDGGGILIITNDDNGDEKAIDVYNEVSNQLMFRLHTDGRIYSPPTYGTTTGNAANMYIHSNGRFYRSTSSARYKKNIEDYTGGLEKLHRIRPVTYEEKNTDDGKRYAGFIAEEMDAAGLVEFVNYDEQDRPDALQYGHITALLAKAVQELDGKVDMLETANTELAQKNTELESRLAAVETKLATGWEAEPAPSGQTALRKENTPLLVIIAFLLGAVLMLLFKPQKAT